MSGFSAIDLSKLPAPTVIEAVEYDALLAEMKAEAIRVMPDLAAFLDLESEPTTQLLRVCAYFRMLDRIEFNDRARACMLPYAVGADLDVLASFWGVERLLVQEANITVTPPIPEIKESDAAFRRRIQLSLEGHTTAGSRGSYVYWALSASGEVKDVSVDSPTPGNVRVTVLSHDGTGIPSATLLAKVSDTLNGEDVRPLTDRVVVQAAEVVALDVTATLTLFDGPDATAVLASAQHALTAYLDTHHRLGHDITISGLHAALHQPGVQNVSLASPAVDLVISSTQVAFCAAPTVTVGGRDV